MNQALLATMNQTQIEECILDTIEDLYEEHEIVGTPLDEVPSGADLWEMARNRLGLDKDQF